MAVERNTLTIDGVHLSFGRRKILTDVYIRLQSGRVAGILGRNGCGKSCLLRILLGELQAQHRSIRFNDKFVSRPFKMKGLLNYLPQHHFAPTFLSVNKLFEWFEVRSDQLLAHYPEIKPLFDRSLSQLSGGERRLIETIAILESKTQFSILDEPFTHLMPLHIEMLKKAIIRNKAYKGILITDHMYEHVLSLSDKLFLLREGKTYPIKDRDDLIDLQYLNA